jgi:hypothetical protein
MHLNLKFLPHIKLTHMRGVPEVSGQAGQAG